ncbi:aminotransferase class V-fold PLP-dependent enzyme [Herbihabitans rhizosphaerae]|nr:aminotransferase class V-fold PLP-dependent enzyme [Herbihabitans rhizosphaerae]
MRTAFGKTFDNDPGFLNTASIGVPPRDAVEELTAAVERWRTGAKIPDYGDHGDIAKQAWARIVGVPAETVALGGSVAQLVGLVASNLPDGARVLVVKQEFTSVAFPFAAQEHRGVKVSEVDGAALASTVDGHDLVAVSVVQSVDGTIADLDALRDAAKATGARVLLDVSQAAGWLPLDLSWADFVVGANYKWLMSPKGASWLAVAPGALDSVTPHNAGWWAGEDPWTSAYGLPLRLAGTARRLDVSPSWFAAVGSAATLPWIASLDMAEVREHCVGLADSVLAGLGLPPRGSAIISLDMPGGAERLTETGVTFSQRAGRIRLAFHLYNTAEDVALVLRALRSE